MAWDSSLNTGIKEVDQQHMTLVEKIGEFAEAIDNQYGSAGINAMLIFLEDYVIKHFLTEEALQASSDYPKYLFHKSIHEGFIQDFTELKNRIDEEGINPGVLRDTQKFLIEWVVYHVSTADMEFGEYYTGIYSE